MSKKDEIQLKCILCQKPATHNVVMNNQTFRMCKTDALRAKNTQNATISFIEIYGDVTRVWRF